jgi:uncharacterized damage-inducible protein DinB
MQTDAYLYGGARALVALHARHMREFLNVWRRADERGLRLPETDDPDYASREALLRHVLACAAGYLRWICEQLQIPAPGIPECPEPEEIREQAVSYLDDVLAAWEQPLRSLTESQAYRPAYPSRWKTPYCIDAMLEHAVMHPIRHTHQLERLLAED